MSTLLTSELVTNVVIHTDTPVVDLRIVEEEGIVRVEVSDRSSAVPAPQYLEPEATSGRGLLLVSTLAKAWGIELRSGGKMVWFELGPQGSG